MAGISCAIGSNDTIAELKSGKGMIVINPIIFGRNEVTCRIDSHYIQCVNLLVTAASFLIRSNV